MKFIRMILCVIILNLQMFSDEKVDINFKNLEIMDLVKITSRIMNKNILYTDRIDGKVDFISNKSVGPDDLYQILIHVLKEKGYTIIQNGDILKIVKLIDSFNGNVPISTNKSKSSYFMVTEVVNVNDVDVDILAAKIRYLLSKDGKLMTNKPTNNFVITDFKDNVETIKKIVSITIQNGKKDIEIVELKNIKSSDAKLNLDAISKSMYDEKVDTEKVDIIDNSINNSIALVGKKSNILYLKNFLEKIDKDKSLIKREVETFSLKNVEATNILKIIEEIIGKKTYSKPDDKPLFSVDIESNSIVVMGPSDEIKYINSLVKKLDKKKAQVYVQARIIELNNELVDRIGISYGLFGGTAGSKGLTAFSSSLNGGSTAINDVQNLLGLKIPDIKSGLALGASLNLLKQNGALNIVSEPSILAVNNNESSIYVGETISIKTETSTTDGGRVSDSYSRKDVGLTLKVKPRISNDLKVTLEINTILEGVKTTQTTSGNADTSKKEINTTAILNNGESVIIGGLIQNKTESTKQKVPFLGDIPILGELFKNSSEDYVKNNLVIIITPYLIPESKDITFVRNQLSELKKLEDDYLENALARLKKDSIKKGKNDNKIKEEIKLNKEPKKENILNKKSEQEKALNDLLYGGNNEN